MIASAADVHSTVGGHPLDEPEGREPRTVRGVVKGIVFVLAGIAGLLSILWLIASLTFGVSLIVFKTGSMAPTIPAGAMAVIRPIPAADIRVGDVVTVAVPGQALPVTHRVLSVTRGSTPDSRILVMKGDANLTQDQFPYTVTQADLVVLSVPELGRALTLLRMPLFIGATTLLVAVLVGWAFWPTRTSAHRASGRSRRRKKAPTSTDGPMAPAPTFSEERFHDSDR